MKLLAQPRHPAKSRTVVNSLGRLVWASGNTMSSAEIMFHQCQAVLENRLAPFSVGNTTYDEKKASEFVRFWSPSEPIER